MKNNNLTDMKFPFCQGCGHGIIVNSISKSINNCGYSALDIVIVSDIGCSGLVDPLFTTHTVHGLHGRAPALGLGISLGLNNPDKKVIVIQGDGGATIGLQHILEAARRNVNMTLVVMNNMLYGMTGGQISGLSTQKFKDLKNIETGIPPFDIVKLAHVSGAAFACRATSISTFTDILTEAFRIDGFSLVELSSLCTSYAFKKLNEFNDHISPPEILRNIRPAMVSDIRRTNSLFENLESVNRNFTHNIDKKIGIILAGSAGGGIQSTATMLSRAAMMHGLNSTMKGEYPVTVGTGFSIAEVIISDSKINYTGLESPQIAIIISEDGLKVAAKRIQPDTKVLADLSLIDSEIKNWHCKSLVFCNFSAISSKKGAALAAVAYWMQKEKLLDIHSLTEIALKHKFSSELIKSIENSKNLKEIKF